MSYHPGKNSLYIPYVDDCLDMTRAAPAPAPAEGQRGEAVQPAPAVHLAAAAPRLMAASPSAGSASVVPAPIPRNSAASPRSTCRPARFSGSTKGRLPATAPRWRRRATSSSGAISTRNSERSMPIREDPLGSDAGRSDSEQHDHLSRERQAVCGGADRSGCGDAESVRPGRGQRHQSAAQQRDSRLRAAVNARAGRHQSRTQPVLHDRQPISATMH